jgi:hypothetical protein
LFKFDNILSFGDLVALKNILPPTRLALQAGTLRHQKTPKVVIKNLYIFLYNKTNINKKLPKLSIFTTNKIFKYGLKECS